MKLRPGRSYPLGAHYDGHGTNFALFSELATRVELCLFDDNGRESHFDLPEMTGFVWHGYAIGVGPGQRYGFRVHGPYNPAEGKRCNPAKLLLDPYARAVEGQPKWDPAMYAYVPGDPDGAKSDADSGPFAPRSIVTNPYFDWHDDKIGRASCRERV